MFYVICPQCGEHIEIHPDAVGPERTDPWNVTGCGDCRVLFDCDDEEVRIEEHPAGASSQTDN